VEEVADAVVMFATCGYITGQSLLMYGPTDADLTFQCGRIEIIVRFLWDMLLLPVSVALLPLSFRRN
jgi:hypothetical protein